MKSKILVWKGCENLKKNILKRVLRLIYASEITVVNSHWLENELVVICALIISCLVATDCLRAVCNRLRTLLKSGFFLWPFTNFQSENIQTFQQQNLLAKILQLK